MRSDVVIPVGGEVSIVRAMTTMMIMMVSW